MTEKAPHWTDGLTARVANPLKYNEKRQNWRNPIILQSKADVRDALVNDLVAILALHSIGRKGVEELRVWSGLGPTHTKPDKGALHRAITYLERLGYTVMKP